jgi:hypothetical protein
MQTAQEGQRQGCAWMSLRIALKRYLKKAMLSLCQAPIMQTQVERQMVKPSLLKETLALAELLRQLMGTSLLQPKKLLKALTRSQLQSLNPLHQSTLLWKLGKWQSISAGSSAW